MLNEHLIVIVGIDVRQVDPSPLGRETVMPGPHRLPRTKHLRRISPRDPAAIPIDDASSIVRASELPSRPARGLRQHRLDQQPLSIKEQP